MKDIKLPENSPNLLKKLIDRFNKLPDILKIVIMLIAGYLIFKLAKLIISISLVGIILFAVTIMKFPLQSLLIILLIIALIYLIYKTYTKKVK